MIYFISNIFLVFRTATARKAPKNFIEDIFLVPDFSKLLQKCMDPKFARFAKEQYTQLQFTFTAVPVSDAYPLGVKTEWRRYASEVYCDIVEDEGNSTIGLKPVNMKTIVYPLQEDGPCHILKSLPDSSITPEPFLEGEFVSN